MSGTDLTVQNIPYQVQSPSCELSGTRTSPAFFVQFKGQVYVANGAGEEGLGTRLGHMYMVLT